jgi:hypothetical protein
MCVGGFELREEYAKEEEEEDVSWLRESLGLSPKEKETKKSRPRNVVPNS